MLSEYGARVGVPIVSSGSIASERRSLLVSPETDSGGDCGLIRSHAVECLSSWSTVPGFRVFLSRTGGCSTSIPGRQRSYPPQIHIVSLLGNCTIVAQAWIGFGERTRVIFRKCGSHLRAIAKDRR